MLPRKDKMLEVVNFREIWVLFPLKSVIQKNYCSFSINHFLVIIHGVYRVLKR